MEQRAKPTEKFNVQKRCEEIHAQYGTSEMANYRIQQMCDKIAQDEEPLFGHTSGKDNHTIWMCFMK
jgi:hypothetical protein